MRTIIALTLAAALLAGCPDDETTPASDAAADLGVDAAATDEGGAVDTATDPGAADPGATDPGTVDTGAADTGPQDTGATDGGATDTGGGDAGGTNSPLFGAIVFNEVLTDGATDGDPNGDGDVADAVGDEFVELVNASGSAVDLEGFTLVETSLPTLPRHTFAAGTTVAAGQAIVVFGGGTAPEAIPGATFVVANAADPGIPFGLSLDNSADVMRLLDADGLLVAEFGYGPGHGMDAITDESFNRDPEITGDFVGHSTISAAAGAIFSPGTAVDGSSF